MLTTKQILEAASLKYGQRFKTLREVEIYLIKHAQIAEEVSPVEMFKLGFELPMHFEDAALCVGEKADVVREDAMRHGIKTMLHLVPRNQLYVEPKYDAANCKTYKRGTPEGDAYLQANGLY